VLLYTRARLCLQSHSLQKKDYLRVHTNSKQKMSPLESFFLQNIPNIHQKNIILMFCIGGARETGKLGRAWSRCILQSSVRMKWLRELIVVFQPGGSAESG
jgi:hypothetical protein